MDAVMRERQQALLDLIRRRKIRTQGELLAGLLEVGINSTQATLSRDIRHLGLVKIRGVYAPPEPARPAADLEKMLSGRVFGLLPAGPNLLVIHTMEGDAMGVAMLLDNMHTECAGTIAGDDTIFAAFASQSDRQAFQKRLERFANPGAAINPRHGKERNE